MTPINAEIQVKNLDHLGIVAGIVDELEIVEIINELLGIQPGEIVSAGVVVKAIILNGLGFVKGPLYLFVTAHRKREVLLTSTGMKSVL